MNLTFVLAVLSLLGSIAAFATVAHEFRSQIRFERTIEADEGRSPSAIPGRILDNRLLLIFLSGAALLIGSLLFFAVPRVFPSYSIGLGNLTTIWDTSPISSLSVPKDEPRSAFSYAILPLSIISAVALAAGAWLIMTGNSFAGAVSLLSGLVMQGYLVGKIEFGDLIGIHLNADRSHLQISDANAISGDHQKLPQTSKASEQQIFTARHFHIEGFAKASANLTSDMRKRLDMICHPKSGLSADAQSRVFLAIGQTDRLPLRRKARRLFESNFGLARARAEEVKTYLASCGTPQSEIITLVSGGRNELAGDKSYDGSSDDRAVDIWAF